MATRTLSSKPLSRSPIDSLARNPADPRQHVDWAMTALVLVLAGIGLAAVYSARYQSLVLAGLDPMFYLERQMLAVGVGSAAMVVVALVDYRRLRDFAPFFYLGSCAVLAVVLVMGRASKGAQAWLEFGPVQFQPSEFAKVALVLMLASFLANDRLGPVVPFPRFVGALALLALPAGLVLLQPDLGSASVLVAITMGILLIAGANFRHILLVSVLMLVSAGVVMGTGTLDKYQQDRLTAFVQQSPTPENRDIILQVRNSKTAIAQGGLTGHGWLKGPLTNGGYVPEQHTDFIFSAVAEQFGLAGAGLVLTLYALLGLRIWRTARLSKDMLGTLIAAGALTMLIWHVFENVGMTMGLTPVTGIPLPLLSYGGSSTVAFFLLVGLVQSVHMRRFT
jgi:rod shape determining protein RodA